MAILLCLLQDAKGGGMLAFVPLMARYRSNDSDRLPTLNRTSTQRATTWLNLIFSTKSVKKSWKRKEKKKRS